MTVEDAFDSLKNYVSYQSISIYINHDINRDAADAASTPFHFFGKKNSGASPFLTETFIPPDLE